MKPLFLHFFQIFLQPEFYFLNGVNLLLCFLHLLQNTIQSHYFRFLLSWRCLSPFTDSGSGAGVASNLRSWRISGFPLASNSPYPNLFHKLNECSQFPDVFLQDASELIRFSACFNDRSLSRHSDLFFSPDAILPHPWKIQQILVKFPIYYALEYNSPFLAIP